MEGRDRGVYRSECFNGTVEYFVHDSNRQLVAKVEMLKGYDGADTEDSMRNWLDMKDPISEPVTAAA